MEITVWNMTGTQREDSRVHVEETALTPRFDPLTGLPKEQSPQPAESPDDPRTLAAGPILLFVHGFGVSQSSAATMTARLSNMLAAAGRTYQDAIAVVWDAAPPFFRAERRADDFGEERLRAELERLHELGAEVDLFGHSLGCRPILAALRSLGTKPTVKNVILLAGAVRDESLDFGKPHHESPKAAEYLYVAHSNRDMVINGLFRIARFTGGLGGGGPERFWKRWNDEDEQLILSNIIVMDCIDVIPDHGDYFQREHAQPLMDRLAQDLNADPIEPGPWGIRIID